MVRRFLLVLCSSASVLFCVATVAFWVRSYYACDSLWWIGKGFQYSLSSSKGELYLQLLTCSDSFIPSLSVSSYPPETDPLAVSPEDVRLWCGFGFAKRIDMHDSFRCHAVILPHWLALLAFAVLPAAWSFRRHRQRDDSACRQCGYNLTSNVSGICPECGEPVPAIARSNS